jgi:hypothetical protein
VDVTADTRVTMPDGYATAAVVATAGDTVVRTPVAVNREGESYDLTVNSLDRAGKPTDNNEVHVLRLDKPGATLVAPVSGSSTAKLRLPKGRYLVATMIRGSGEERTMLVQPLLTLDKAQAITMDARIGKPVSVKVPRAGAKAAFAYLGVTTGTDDTHTSSLGALLSTFDGLYSAQVGPANPTDPVVSQVAGRWGEPHNSPYLYALAWSDKGRFPTGVRRTVAERDLAIVRADIGNPVPGVRAAHSVFSGLAGRRVGSWSHTFDYDLPTTTTEYYNTGPGVVWSSQLVEVVPGTGPANPERTITQTQAKPTTYRPGQTYQQTWNRGVFGPSVAGDSPLLGAGRAARLGDQVVLDVPLFADHAGRPVSTVADSERLTVYRDGKKIGETPKQSGEFTLPARDGVYKVTADVARGAPFALSTRVHAAWTFRSGHVGGKTPKPLPLMAMRFTPALDRTGSAPADSSFTIPLVVGRQGSAGRPRHLAVQASFDEGETWQPLPVAGDRVQIRHPKGPGTVSLKATAVDANGNQVEETIIRAYRF